MKNTADVSAGWKEGPDARSLCFLSFQRIQGIKTEKSDCLWERLSSTLMKCFELLMVTWERLSRTLIKCLCLCKYCKTSKVECHIVDWFSQSTIDTSVDTPFTFHQCLGQQPADIWLFFEWCMCWLTLGQLSTNCLSIGNPGSLCVTHDITRVNYREHMRWSLGLKVR